MNREIKFRAWVNDRMAYNVGFHPFMSINLVSAGLCDESEANKDERLIWSPNLTNIMQFTGLLDKNGKDIYERDVVRILYTDWPSKSDDNISLEDYLISISHIGEVVYNAPQFQILMVEENIYGERPYCSFNHGPHGRIEVIGNLFENSDLLIQK